MSAPPPNDSRTRHYSTPLLRVLASAREVARAQACPAVDAEHLALALLDEQDCAARRLLCDLRVDLSALRIELAEAAAARSTGDQQPPDEPALTPRAERALQIAWVEARTDHGRRAIPFEAHGRVGTQHLLLGLTSPAGEVQMPALRRRGVFYSEVAAAVRRLDAPTDEATGG